MARPEEARRGADIWWQQKSGNLERAKNLTVMNLPPETSQTLAKLAQIKMQLHCTIQDGEIWLADSNDRVQVNPVTIKTSSAPDR